MTTRLVTVGRAALVTVAAAGLVAVTPRPAAAQDACIGQPVAKVVLQVVGHPDYSQSMLSLLDVQPQKPFTREAWHNATQQLIKLGGFEDVTISCAPVEGGWQVVFSVAPPHPVTDLEFRGVLDLSGALKKRVLERFGGMPATIAPEVVKGVVLDLLQDEGYFEAAATVTPKKFANPDRTTLIFEVALGTRAKLGAVKIAASNDVAVPKDWVERETNAVEGRPFQPSRIDRGLARIVNTLKSRGYYTATALPIEKGAITDHTHDITLTIETGNVVVLQWDRAGDAPGDINDFVPVRAQNSIDPDLLDDAVRRIRAELQSQGYRDAEVSHTQSPQPGDRLAITYLVHRGPKFRVERVQFPAVPGMTPKDVDLAFGMKRGDVFDPAKVRVGLIAIQSELRLRGYYTARAALPPDLPVAPNRSSNAKETWRIVPVNVIPGVKGERIDIRIAPATVQVPEADVRQAIQAVHGSDFRTSSATVQGAVKTYYDNLGYRNAVVSVSDAFTPEGRIVNRIVRIDEGTRLVVLDVTVIGAKDINESEIRREIVLHAGDPFGALTQRVSQSRLYNWGVFRSVTIEPLDPPKPSDTGVHLIVRVVEAPDTTVSYGGDVEVGYKKRTVSTDPTVPLADTLEFAPRGFFEIGRRNLGGRNRVLDLFTRLSLRPRDAPGDPTKDGKGYRPSEYRVALTYAEKRAFGTNIDWIFGVSSEQALRTTFDFQRQAANMDFTRRLSQRVTANLRYTLDFTRVYNQRFCAAPTSCTATELQNITATDRVFPQVRLSIIALDILADRRDDPVWPTKGSFITGDTEIALRGIGSEVGYTKTLIQAAKYGHLKGTRRIVAAARVEFGFAHGFRRPNPSFDPADPTSPQTIADIPISQRFFAGGSTTVRGYTTDALGAPGVLTDQGLSVGGNGLVIVNIEMREILGNLFGRQMQLVQFFDTGNVFREIKDLSLEHLRSSVGGGLRYLSPIGPIRFDVGIKTRRLTFVNQATERRWEFHVSFGQAF